MTQEEVKHTKVEVKHTKVELSRKEQFIEMIANVVAILMLFAFFLKVLFF